MVSISKPCFNEPNICEKTKGDWDFIEALTNPSYKYRELRDQPEQVYVHPNAKRSTSLSAVCTECLGSETGNNIVANADEFPVFEKQGPHKIIKANKSGQTNSFPPPLNSIGGGDGVRMKAHREGGRLMITAHSNGRLRLSFVKDDRHELYGNVDVQEEEVGDEDADEVDVRLWGQKIREGGVVGGRVGSGEWPSSCRCNGEESGFQSLQFCVAIS